MGADHKGPLAAFVVIAIIAAVLLVTSVRSQAYSGVLMRQQVAAGHPDHGVPRRVSRNGTAGVSRQASSPRRTAARPSRGTVRDLPDRPGRVCLEVVTCGGGFETVVADLLNRRTTPG